MSSLKTEEDNAFDWLAFWLKFSIFDPRGLPKSSILDTFHSAITCSNLTIETLKQGVKFVQS